MKTKEIFQCRSCGEKTPQWKGQCPSCGNWNTLAAVTVAARPGKSARPAPSGEGAPVRLKDVSALDHEGRSTGFASLDAVLGKGLVPGGAVLLGGEPGIGKSTLLLQLAGRLAASGRAALYCSGEESLPQLKSRASRLGLLDCGLSALATTSADDVLASLSGPLDLLVVDSVQTLASSRAEGIPGSVSQVRAVAGELVEAVKKTGCTLVLVGHVTKDGQIAGPKLLEHMVDTVLYLEGDRQMASRLLRVLKNRFGPSDELVVFTMAEQGLQVVDDPSTLFLGARDAGLPGTALVMAMDGQRPFAVEVQALAAKTYLSIPRRTALGFDTNGLNLLLAVLEKRLKLNLSQFDIYAKIGGGLSLRDPGLDLGVAAAVLSSYYDRALPENAVFWGEVDLNGQVRPAAGHDIRLRQARRLGYEAVHADVVKTLADLQRRLFGKA